MNDVPLDWFRSNVALDSLFGDVPLDLFCEANFDLFCEATFDLFRGTSFNLSKEGYIVLNFCFEACVCLVSLEVDGSFGILCRTGDLKFESSIFCQYLGSSLISLYGLVIFVYFTLLFLDTAFLGIDVPESLVVAFRITSYD